MKTTRFMGQTIKEIGIAKGQDCTLIAKVMRATGDDTAPEIVGDVAVFDCALSDLAILGTFAMLPEIKSIEMPRRYVLRRDVPKIAKRVAKAVRS